MSFSSKIKDELALLHSEYEKDEMSALFKCAGNITISNNSLLLTFKSENSKITQKVYRYILQTYKIHPKTAISKTMKLNKHTNYSVIISENVNQIISDFGLLEDIDVKQLSKDGDRIRAYLAGLFLGCGSINDPSAANYHLELCVLNENYAEDIAKLLAKIDIKAKVIKRRSQYVVYVKKAAKVADFIINIGATQSYFEFEDIRIQRDFINNNNRVNNCDIANFVRTNVAAQAQLEDIETIEKYISIKALKEELYILCKLRKENPEDSLKMLAVKFEKITQKPITKSGINHLFIKIKEHARMLKNGDNNG